MAPFLKSEIRRIRINQLTGQNPLLEIKKIIQLFYLRERGEKTRMRDMNPYARDFLQKCNRDFFRSPPFDDKPVLETLTELLTTRLQLPEAGPEEVFRSWLPDHFAKALDVIPVPILEEGGFGKVCRVMGGVFLYALSDLNGISDQKIMNNRLEQAIKGGYYYGMFYPLIDDILDHSRVMSGKDKQELINILNHWITGDFTVSNPLSSNPSVLLLLDIMKAFHQLFPLEEHPSLYRASLMLHFSQIEDLQKSFAQNYKAEEIYVPVIIKAAYTRIIATEISGMKMTDSLRDQMIETGLTFQLMDDFRDWVDDYRHALFTPFTYYLKGPSNQEINPFSLYLAGMRVYFKRFKDDRLLVQLMMRRLAISIQRFCGSDVDQVLDKECWRVIGEESKTGQYVRRIHGLRYRIMDPDADFTGPIDKVVNRGR